MAQDDALQQSCYSIFYMSSNDVLYFKFASWNFTYGAVEVSHVLHEILLGIRSWTYYNQYVCWTG